MMSKGVSDQGGSVVGQIFILKQIGEKAHEKSQRMYASFMDLEVYDRINKEAIWQMLKCI